VGQTTIYPPGHLLSRIDANLAERISPLPEQLVEDYRRDLLDQRWATIRIPVLAPGGKIDEPTMDLAREVARDTIAVLRLFQRARVRYVSLDRQTFGLATDIGSVVEQRWVTDAVGRYAGMGWTLHGVFGAEWRFKTADLRAYHHDPRFAYLNRALAAGDAGRDDWQRRAITAIRTMNIATVMQRPANRIVLMATSVEALLGDEFDPSRSGAGGDQLARRAAYIWCGTDFDPRTLHRPGSRPACGLLTAKRDPKKDPRLYDRASGVWACSWYGAVRNLYDDRNAALHGSATFDQRAATRHEFNLDKVVLATVDWVLDRRPSSIADLDSDIAALPPDPAIASAAP
jgi:hypothetical protein